jgi:hypothetical protein
MVSLRPESRMVCARQASRSRCASLAEEFSGRLWGRAWTMCWLDSAGNDPVDLLPADCLHYASSHLAQPTARRRASIKCAKRPTQKSTWDQPSTAGRTGNP